MIAIRHEDEASEKVPKILVKAGKFDNSLEDIVKKFSGPIELVKVGLGNTIKYAIFKEVEEPYLLIISQQKNRLISPADYNTLMTVTSYSNKKNHEIVKRFEYETGTSFNIDVSEKLKKYCSLINFSFNVFEENPKKAMKILVGY